MTDKHRIQSLEARRAALRARLARAPKAAPSPTHSPAARPRDLITLGTDAEQREVFIADTPRLEHMHVIGATGSGKSTFLLNGILQDIARGRGVCVLDPHGGHPDSLMNTVLRFLIEHRWFDAARVHILAPNVAEQVVGFNPLAPLPGTDPAVIAGAMLAAFERAWGDEDTHAKPTTRRLLRTAFTALAECRLTLPDAVDLLDYDDHRLRLNVLSRLQDEFARRDLERIEALASTPRGRREFEEAVLGPMNRLAEFVSCDAIRTMLAMSREHDEGANTLDLLDIMDRGHVLLVDLQHGSRVDEAATDLLGKILLRYLFLLIAHRRPYRLPESEEERYHPFFVYVDECHRYVTEDIQGLLTEARKYSLGVALAHQYLAQLGKPGERVYEAVRNSTEIKAVFRVKSAREAQELAHDVLPLSLQLPVEASVRPVQVGFEIKELANKTYSVHEGEGESVAQHAAEAITRGRTAMQHWMRAVGRATSVSRGSGTSTSSGFGTSEGLSAVESHMDSMAYTYDPNTQTFIGAPMPSVQSVGSSDAGANALLSSTSTFDSSGTSQFESVSETTSESEGIGGGLAFSESRSQAQGTSRGRHTTKGTTAGAGSAQALFPLYKELPTAFHSKEHALYLAGEIIRTLPVGRAVLRFRDTVTLLTVLPPRKPSS
jgi:hypothetical protein